MCFEAPYQLHIIICKLTTNVGHQRSKGHNLGGAQNLRISALPRHLLLEQINTQSFYYEVLLASGVFSEIFYWHY